MDKCSLAQHDPQPASQPGCGSGPLGVSSVLPRPPAPSCPSIQVLTGHLESVSDSLVLEQAGMGHHTGQRLPIHAATGHQVELGGDSGRARVCEGAARGCAFDLSVPGHAGGRAALSRAGGCQGQALTLFKWRARVQGGKRRHCREVGGRLLVPTTRQDAPPPPISAQTSQASLFHSFLFSPAKVSDEWQNFR